MATLPPISAPISVTRSLVAPFPFPQSTPAWATPLPPLSQAVHNWQTTTQTSVLDSPLLTTRTIQPANQPIQTDSNLVKRIENDVVKPLHTIEDLIPGRNIRSQLFRPPALQGAKVAALTALAINGTLGALYGWVREESAVAMLRGIAVFGLPALITGGLFGLLGGAAAAAKLQKMRYDRLF